MMLNRLKFARNDYKNGIAIPTGNVAVEKFRPAQEPNNMSRNSGQHHVNAVRLFHEVPDMALLQ